MDKKYYLINTTDVGPNCNDIENQPTDFMYITNQPGRKNLSNAICTDGWLGQSGDTNETAYGEFNSFDEAMKVAIKHGYTEEFSSIYMDENSDETYIVKNGDQFDHWSADDWYSGCDPNITAELTDDDLDKIADSEYDDAFDNENNVHGILEYITEMRDGLKNTE